MNGNVPSPSFGMLKQHDVARVEVDANMVAVKAIYWTQASTQAKKRRINFAAQSGLLAMARSISTKRLRTGLARRRAM